MKNLRTYITVGVILVVIAAIGAQFVVFRPPSLTAAVFDSSNSAGAQASFTPAAVRTPPAGYVEYRDTQYNFSLFYPQGLAVKTYDEGGGASTFTFQNVTTAQGFQIFIVPYSGTTVSEQRFKEDEPSGVRNNSTYVFVGGVPAAAFYGNDVRLGETYEVWFIHGGYLYEVTTLKPLDTWLENVVQTWQFFSS